MRPTFRIGPVLSVVSASAGGAVLAGTRRLPPGRVVTLTGLPSDVGPTRPAYVSTWRVATIDAAGVTYSGVVEWTCGEPAESGIAGDRVAPG